MLCACAGFYIHVRDRQVHLRPCEPGELPFLSLQLQCRMTVLHIWSLDWDVPYVHAQVLETLCGLGIVFVATRKWKPLSPDLLKFDLRWAAIVCLYVCVCVCVCVFVGGGGGGGGGGSDFLSDTLENHAQAIMR